MEVCEKPPPCIVCNESGRLALCPPPGEPHQENCDNSSRPMERKRTPENSADNCEEDWKQYESSDSPIPNLRFLHPDLSILFLLLPLSSFLDFRIRIKLCVVINPVSEILSCLLNFRIVTVVRNLAKPYGNMSFFEKSKKLCRRSSFVDVLESHVDCWVIFTTWSFEVFVTHEGVNFTIQ